MKKTLLLTLPLIVMSLASCEKRGPDNSPIIQFKDQKFLEALLAPMPIEDFVVITVDKDGDGQVTEKEASDVTAMNLYGKEIRNMEEIKYFTSLVVMDCGSNQLTSLDMSNNKALMSLTCDNNQLTSLDIWNNPDLSVLHCNGNQLTSLDVSNNTALEYLGCYDNPLKTLAISQSQENVSWLDDIRRQYPDIEIIVK